MESFFIGLYIGIGIGAFLALFMYGAWPELFFGIIESSKFLRSFRKGRRNAWITRSFKGCENRKNRNTFIKSIIDNPHVPVNKKDLLLLLELLSESGKLSGIHEFVLNKIRSKKIKLTDEDMVFIINCYKPKLNKEDFDLFYHVLLAVHEAVY